MKKFELTTLPYAADAPEPATSKRTIGFHHGKHLLSYVNILNKCIVFLFCCLCTYPAFSQEQEPQEQQKKIRRLGCYVAQPPKEQKWCRRFVLQTRMDFDFQHHEDTALCGASAPNTSSFQGKHLNFIMEGDLTSTLSYSYRQRINIANINFSQTFFQATDWLHLDWHFADRLYLSAGKEVVAIGAWEYDVAPIDMYFFSEFYNNINCFEMGFSLHYEDEYNHLQLQLCNSPYVEKPLQNLYAVNLMWNGNFDWFKTIYSSNLIGYEPDKFMHYLVLGHKLDFLFWSLYVDVMNRTALNDYTLFRDYSVMAEFKWRSVVSRFSLFIKGGYDENSLSGIYLMDGNPRPVSPDIYVAPGFAAAYAGVGGEFFPWSADDQVRLHAYVAARHDASWCVECSAGLTWRLNPVNVTNVLRN
ncbi:MAG: hypothetical protein J5792_04165 [Bacteroidales bacterium]|nr:hypothetical protein [Bacteroidales bacterium]